MVPQPACVAQGEVIESEVFVAWDVRSTQGVGVLVLLKCVRSTLASLNKVCRLTRGILDRLAGAVSRLCE